ncbi:uncharacterized protein LOC118606675 [Rousettus aegyptiacus]|uniref:uncharacterized protein LOC118606675 n=1 Tax=Rousettus aegyptiacus TaxID=9407 RepID=UPI00168D8F04|nr:uncharacterized protein LOC118606675 [Rousettus aegyptiacus]
MRGETPPTSHGCGSPTAGQEEKDQPGTATACGTERTPETSGPREPRLSPRVLTDAHGPPARPPVLAAPLPRSSATATIQSAGEKRQRQKGEFTKREKKKWEKVGTLEKGDTPPVSRESAKLTSKLQRQPSHPVRPDAAGQLSRLPASSADTRLRRPEHSGRVAAARRDAVSSERCQARSDRAAASSHQRAVRQAGRGRAETPAGPHSHVQGTASSGRQTPAGLTLSSTPGRRLKGASQAQACSPRAGWTFAGSRVCCSKQQVTSRATRSLKDRISTSRRRGAWPGRALS